MEVLKNKYRFENTINRDNENFEKFEKMIFKFFDFKKEFKKHKDFSLKSIEFQNDCIIARYKTFLWFEDGNVVRYDRIIKQVQIYLTNKYKKNNFIFAEKIDDKNEIIYYVKIEDVDKEEFCFENKCKIDLYLHLYEKYLMDS